MWSNETNSSETFCGKTSVKLLELPIQKFNTAIPHFITLLKSHNNNLSKLKRNGDWNEIKKEQAKGSKIISQLTSLLSEIDNLRNQVSEAELSKFDKLIKNSKESAIDAIENYKDITVSFQQSNCPTREESGSDVVNGEQDQQLELIADLTEYVKKQEQNAASMEKVHEDIQDVNFMFKELSQLVHDQGENVEKIEEYVEVTHQHVLEGESMLRQAARYKKSTYPLVGALIGSLVGGPIGLVAGIKLGSLTAVGCGFLGFTGGRFLKSQNEVTIKEAEHHREELAK